MHAHATGAGWLIVCGNPDCEKRCDQQLLLDSSIPAASFHAGVDGCLCAAADV
jgi:hypothetical protein